MEKNRQSRIIAIVALCVAVLCLTLGFAVFSNTLTIQSSATVTPDKSDFKMTAYGVADSSFDAEDWFWVKSDENLTSKSSTLSVPYLTGKATASNAVIDNNSLTINFSSMNFVGTGDVIEYYFEIANEGKYTAYLKDDVFGDITGILTNQKTCVAEDGTSQDMVTKACGSVRVFADATDNGDNWLSSTGSTYQYLEIPAGGYMKMYFHFIYDGSSVADGDWSIEFPEVELEFTTVNPDA